MCSTYEPAALIGPFAGHDDTITGLAFTLDEKAVASSSEDSTILVWDIASTPPRRTRVTADEVDQAWQSWPATTPKSAFERNPHVGRQPGESIKRIGDRIKPAEPLDKEWVARPTARSRQSEVRRTRAAHARTGTGGRTGGAIPGAVARGQTIRRSSRTSRTLLVKVRSPADVSARAVQERRGLEILEWIGNDAGRVG